MINTNTSIASLLSNIYQTNGAALTDSLTRIASGKRVQSPGDDFAGYIRASGLNTDIAGYQVIKQDLQEAKALVNYGKEVGNDIAEDLTRMKELADLYSKATGDADRQAGYKAEFDTIVDRVNALKTDSYYDNTQVYAATSLKTVSINADNTSLQLDITTTAVGNEASVNDITAANVASDIQNEINNAQTYVAEMESFSTQIDRNLKLSDTIISSKQATVSAIIDVDEVKELANVTNLQVRQQASVAMMSQANTSQVAIARLFQ